MLSVITQNQSPSARDIIRITLRRGRTWKLQNVVEILVWGRYQGAQIQYYQNKIALSKKKFKAQLPGYHKD